MARKKATPVEEPEQSGEDAFLEQTGETAEGVAGAENSGEEMGADSTEAPGEGSVEQPGPESMTPPPEEGEATMPSDETPPEDAGSTAPPAEVPEEEPPGEGPHETVEPGEAPPPGGEEAEWPPAEGSAWPELTGDGGAETESHGPCEVVSVDLSAPVDASAVGAASPAEGEGELPGDPAGGELPPRSGVEPHAEEIPPAPGDTPPEPTDRQKFYGLKFNRLDRDLTPDERQEWNSIYASYRGRSALTGTIIGIDPYSVRVRNPETGEMEKQTMYCAIVVPYRVRIVIPATEMWEQGRERPEFVMQNMVGSSIDFIIIKVDRESGFAIGSRRLALRARRYYFAHRPNLNAIGTRLKCRVMAVGPRRCLVEFYGHDINLTQREIRYTSIPDLRDEYHPGQELECIVKVYDPDTDRVEISVKETESNPYDGAEQRHPIGSRRQAMIAGKYGGGVFCNLPDGTVCMCNYSYQHEDSDFLVGDTVILVVQRYAEEKKQMYGKILSKW